MRKLEFTENCFGGKIVVFEGTDGSGKTTSINMLLEHLKNKGLDAIYVRVLSEKMEKLKSSLLMNNHNELKKDVNLTNFVIMAAGNRLIMQDEIVIPALKQNKIVICDRYCFSGYVKCSESIIYQISKRFLKPDLCFLCNCKNETAQKRILARTKEKDSIFDAKAVSEERKKFREIARKNDFVIVDTDKSVDECFETIVNAIEKI